MRYGKRCRNPWMHQRLVEEGLRLTEARRIILDILAGSSEHLSAEDIYMVVRGINPSVGFATVYRTLDILTRMCIVQKFDFGDGKARYELIGEEKNEAHHHHLVCRRCRKIINYTDFIEEEKELIKKTEEALARKHGFEIQNHIIHFYGLCEQCKGGE